MTIDELSVSSRGVKFAAAILFLLGWWLFVSPWVYGASWETDAWNSWIVGPVIAIIGVIRYSSRAGLTAMKWITVLLGGWIFFSPWAYGYSDNFGRLGNSLCVGVAVFVISMTAWSTYPRARHIPRVH